MSGPGSPGSLVNPGLFETSGPMTQVSRFAVAPGRHFLDRASGTPSLLKQTGAPPAPRQARAQVRAALFSGHEKWGCVRLPLAGTGSAGRV